MYKVNIYDIESGKVDMGAEAHGSEENTQEAFYH